MRRKKRHCLKSCDRLALLKHKGNFDVKTLSEAFIKNDDSAGGAFYLMKKVSEMEKMAALTGKILTGKEEDSQEITNQTRRKCDMENFKEEVAQQKDDLATYNGRAWEDLSNTELESISRDYYSSRPGGLENLHNRRAMKAGEVLQARKEARKSEYEELQKKKMQDDGSIKAFIANGNYNDIGNGVMIRKVLDGETAWTVKGGGMTSEAMTVTKSGYFNEIEEVADNVRTFCRRKFKKEDIILCSVDSFYSTENGIVFLEDKICTFDEKKLEYIISYAEMEDIDFDEDSVTINVSSGEEVTLYCGDEEEYSKGVFNLLMDIKDRLAQA